MNNAKVLQFRVLVLVGAGLMLLSWFLPWWSINVYEIGKDAAVIRPWGLETHLRESEYALIAGAEMPAWFAPFTFTYLGIAVLALLFSVLANNKEIKVGNFKFTLPRLLIALVGLSYVVVVVTAFVVAKMRTGEYFGGINLIGYTYIDLGEPYMSGADAGFLPGYWLACVVGPLLFILAIFRNKIVGEPKVAA